MPSKNSEKIYFENAYYHLYNRGVEKRNIFMDAPDYSVFLGYLKEYLTPKNEAELVKMLGEKDLEPSERDKILSKIRLNNFHGEIELLAYCLMPNHFHLLVKQKNPKDIDKFLNSLITRYVVYFNRKHQRVGHLFQDVYKAVVVESGEQLLHLSRYIHRNPLALERNGLKHQEMYTSLPEYMARRKTTWINPKEVLNTFSQSPVRAYLNFVDEIDDLENLGNLIIEKI